MKRERKKIRLLLVAGKLKLLIPFLLIINQEVDIVQSTQSKSSTGRVASQARCQPPKLKRGPCKPASKEATFELPTPGSASDSLNLLSRIPVILRQRGCIDKV